MIGSATALLAYLMQFKYVALFVTLFLSAAFVPISGELIMVGAGAVVASGMMELFLALAISLIANVLGDTAGYSFMRFFGNRFGRKFEEKSKLFRSIGTYLHKHPVFTVFFSRFIGFATGQINFLAGLTRTHIRDFLLGDIIGNTICVLIYIFTGYIAECTGHNIQTVAGIIAGVLLFFGVVSILTTVYLEKRSKK